MLRAGLSSLVATALIPALALQVPLRPGDRWRDEHLPAILGDEDMAKWSLDRLPNPNGTDHLIFETVHSLLQHWPNTRMRNGHNIVPGSIPRGTLLYHGASRRELPPGLEWVATDPEHSYLFCRDDALEDLQQDCWHLTLVATRPLKVVYFDGSSAAKLPYGSLDTQDLLVWGRPSPEDQPDESERLRSHYLCNWGKSFGVDGFVRMELDFEVILCDFTSGVRVVSWANLVNRRVVNNMMSAFIAFAAKNAGAWHDRFPGETRVQLDLAGLVSFYDTQLVPSLIEVRAGQERWDHRVQNVSSEDLSAVKSRLEATLTKPRGPSSGIDWKTLIQVIVDRYAERLELTRYLLNSPATAPDEILDLANKTQSQLRIMLTPYLLFSARPTDISDKAELDWTAPVYRLCAMTHTHFMESELDSMTDSEKLLLQAVRGTSREICRVVTKMWAAGVYAGMDPMLNTKGSFDITEVIQLRNTWAEDLNGLMGWLDWNVWVKCHPRCDIKETCYLPTWTQDSHWTAGIPSSSSDSDRPHRERPAGSGFDFRAVAAGGFAEEVENTIKLKSDEWTRPQPTCVPRIYPHKS